MNLSSLPLLTQSSTFIIGPIAKIFGVIMNGIYDFFYQSMNIESIGFSIIAFTVLIRVLLVPLALKQQKSMLDMQKVQPELKKLQEKYKNKKDAESQKLMQAESAKLYQDHNVNPLGGCLPLVIQMPILFALFAVLRAVPAYIVNVKEVYVNIVTQVSSVTGFETILTTFSEAKKGIVKNFDPTSSDKVIDLFANFKSSDWISLKEQFPGVLDQITPLIEKINQMHYFFGINLADNPVDISQGISGVLTLGILIPILCFLSQLLVMKTTPQTSTGNAQQDQTQKTMMIMMPVMTLFFVVSMPAGMGLYWLTGNIFQFFQQYIINKHVMKVINK